MPLRSVATIDSYVKSSDTCSGAYHFEYISGGLVSIKSGQLLAAPALITLANFILSWIENKWRLSVLKKKKPRLL
jgi:hypothetical protein